MKKSHLLRCLVLALVFAGCSFASEFRSFVLDVAPGSSPEAVKKSLGAPSAVLGQDVWVYLNFAKANPNAANPAFDTLVVAFTHGKVTAVKITDGRVVRQLLAQQTAQAAKASVAAK